MIIYVQNYENLCLTGMEVWVGREGKDGRKWGKWGHLKSVK
jgi:hypothetical protein